MEDSDTPFAGICFITCEVNGPEIANIIVEFVTKRQSLTEDYIEQFVPSNGGLVLAAWKLI